jgi:hypothetical protein
MNPRRKHSIVHAELDTLLREGLLAPDIHDGLVQRYPVTRWDWRSLARWFLIFGAVTVAAGAIVLGRELFQFTLEKLALSLALLAPALFAGARALLRRQPPWPWSARGLELLAGFVLIGLTFVLGALYGSGSGNWPALLAVDLAALLALAYLLRNPLLLVLSAVVFFCWFGGFTGYASGWHAYWFGMSYPLRFLAAAVCIVAMGVAHLQAEQSWLYRHTGFAKIWISAGLFFAEMSLWLMSLFGNFNLEKSWRLGDGGELALFNLMWLILNLLLMVLGNRLGARMLTGYGATFLIIQIYTAFFAHLAEHLGGFLSLLLSGAIPLAGVLWFESRRRQRPTVSPAAHEMNGY